MKTNDEYTGGSTTYYQVDITHPINEQSQPYVAECIDIIDALHMTPNEANAFKALWRRCAARTLGKSKRGYTDGLYDAEKVVFYGERLVQLEQRQRSADGVEQKPLPLTEQPGDYCLPSVKRTLPMPKCAPAKAPQGPEDEQRIDAIGQNGNDGEHYRWTTHPGAGPVSVPSGAAAELKHRDGTISQVLWVEPTGSHWTWAGRLPCNTDIIAYRQV